MGDKVTRAKQPEIEMRLRIRGDLPAVAAPREGDGRDAVTGNGVVAVRGVGFLRAADASVKLFDGVGRAVHNGGAYTKMRDGNQGCDTQRTYRSR